YITPNVIDVRESCQKLSVRDPETQEIVVTDDLQTGDQITAGVYAGKYVTEIIVPGGKFTGIEGGFRPPFVSGGVQQDRIREIWGEFGYASVVSGQAATPYGVGAIRAVNTTQVPGVGGAGTTRWYYDFCASHVVKTGPDGAGTNLSTRLWRCVS
ncbi:MAG: hypothetical protein LBO80_09245, partial [Treponema sp.]|nr:hypothetical protein [Treponema sp.]